jgi:hypothetical protein
MAGILRARARRAPPPQNSFNASPRQRPPLSATRPLLEAVPLVPVRALPGRPRRLRRGQHARPAPARRAARRGARHVPTEIIQFESNPVERYDFDYFDTDARDDRVDY